MSDVEEDNRNLGESDEESLDSVDENGSSDQESVEPEDEEELVEPEPDEESELGILELGKVFNSMQELKNAIFRYSISAKKDLQFKKCESERLTAVCSFDGCPWRLHASIHSGTKLITIKVLKDEHRCINMEKNKLVKVPRLVEMFIEAIRENPGIKPAEMRALMLTDYNVRVSLPQCVIARTKCLRILEDDHVEQFHRLWDYVAEIRRSNPGSTIELETDGNVFQRIYIMLGALKEGWRWCRSVIHLDGAFLKWQMKGEVLSAVARDANDQLYPIAWAVVDVENKKNWIWFIEHLKEDLNLGQGEGLTMISDQQKGIIHAVLTYLPIAEHRMCARHIWANLKKTYNSDEVRKFFWAASKSYSETHFRCNMERLKSVSLGAYNEREYRCSCRYYDLSGIPCGHIIAAVWDFSRESVEAEGICSDCWTSDRWKNTYVSVLQPVNGMRLWLKTTDISVQPPPNKLMPGRPKKRDRKKEAHESVKKKGYLTSHGRSMRCRHCQEEGHNARGCPKKNEPAVAPKEKGTRGRPRKNPIEQVVAPTQESVQMLQPSQGSNVQQEGSAMFYNPMTGDTYYHFGTSAIDNRENTILGTTLQAERDRLIRRPRNDYSDL